MAPHTFHLLSVSPTAEESVIKTLWSHTPKPVTIGKAHYFLSSSHLSSTLANRPSTHTSPFNLVAILPGTSTPLPSSVSTHITSIWSLTADIDEQWTINYAAKNSSLLHANKSSIVPFPLEPEIPKKEDEEEVEFPLTPTLRTFLSTFSHQYSGPVTMFNFLSFHEGMFPQYQKYMADFMEILGPKYGCEPRLVGPLVKIDGEEGGEKWDMVGWIHYPGAASFGRMLEDEKYKVLDRKYKKGVVRDNPILLIVELEE
ncbi:hypothetical protein N431DRAFT_564426 [Stipitochalara longipes BDJ]|nr:hypothetical protein N431DRAFT_564426 [Stipitochalara longipes BDJ]